MAGYWVQRQVNGVWTDWSSTNIDPSIVYLQPLTPGTTYTVVAVAFDPSGNRSQRSDPVTFATTSQPAPTCRVMRQILGDQAYFLTPIIENLTVATVSNWTMTFTMPAAHTKNYIFNATLARSGDAATVTPTPNVAQISPWPHGVSAAQARRMDKLQRAGRDFLMRLVAKHGPRGAAPILRALADELDGLPAGNVPHFSHSTEQEAAVIHTNGSQA